MENIKRGSPCDRMKAYEKIIIYTVLVIAMICTMIPMIQMVSAAFSEDALIKLKGLSIFPRGFSLAAFQSIFIEPSRIVKSYLTSLSITIVGIPLNLFLVVLVAYPLADVEFKWRGAISFYVFFTMLFGAGLIPTYIIMRTVLNLYDKWLILVLMPLVGPGSIFMCRIFFQNVPSSIYESARMDGANEFRILFQISVPIIKVGLVTMAFQLLLGYWNDATTALYFTESYIPVALYLQQWSEYLKELEQNPDITGGLEIPRMTIKFAMGIISALPLAIMFLLFQKQFVSGLTDGAVKG